MQIMNLEKSSKGFKGWLQEDGFYKRFETHEGRLATDILVPVKNYKDYETFAMIVGKFNPYVTFLREPVEIGALTFEELRRVYEMMKGGENDG